MHPGGVIYCHTLEKLSEMGRELMPKVKLVEQSGLMLKTILTSSNPWKLMPCSSPQCTFCLPGKFSKPGSCKVRYVVYTNICLHCSDKGVYSRYNGETGRNTLGRMKEHQAEALARNKRSHMWEHMSSNHPHQLSDVLSSVLVSNPESLSIRPSETSP